jgi:hypothetical protein
MKTEEQIAARVQELRLELKRAERKRKDYARGKGNRGTLGIRRIREMEGEILALTWVLESANTATNNN